MKNPNWWEANQLAIYNRSREVVLGASENSISYGVRTGFQIRRSNHSATLPPRGMLIVPIQLEEKICFHVISWSSKIKQDPQDFLSHLTSRRPNCAYYLLTFRLDGIAVWKWSILNFRVFTPHDIKMVVRELSRMFKTTHLCCKFILKQVYVSEQVFMWKLTGLTGSFFWMYASVSDLSNCFPSALFVSFRISETCRNEIPHRA